MNALQFLLSGMPGNMKPFAFFINHIGTFSIKLVDDLGNRFFVARNGGCGNYDSIPADNIDLLLEDLETAAVRFLRRPEYAKELAKYIQK